MRKLSLLVLLWLVAASALAQGPIRPHDAGPAAAPADPLPTNRVIVKFADTQRASIQETGALGRSVRSMGEHVGIELVFQSAISDALIVVAMPERPDVQEVGEIAARIAQMEGIEYAVPDFVRTSRAQPNDPFYSQYQWHYWEPVSSALWGAANLPLAWDITQGSAEVVVAILDSGLVAHQDISGKAVPGYDFVEEIIGGWDPGDWNLAGECGPGSPARPSSWHGTMVGGIVGAQTDNALGIAGVGWDTRVLPVRVLGRCGGTDSDVLRGIRWAAGLSRAFRTTPTRSGSST